MEKDMIQTTYRGNGKKAMVTRFKGQKHYSTAFFRDENALKTYDVQNYVKLSWAINDAKEYVKSWTGE